MVPFSHPVLALKYSDRKCLIRAVLPFARVAHATCSALRSATLGTARAGMWHEFGLIPHKQGASQGGCYGLCARTPPALGHRDTAATSPSTGDQLVSVPVLTGGFKGSDCPLIPVGESRVVTLSWLFPTQFPHCRDTPQMGQGPSGGRCHLGTSAPADTLQLQPPH